MFDQYREIQYTIRRHYYSIKITKLKQISITEDNLDKKLQRIAIIDDSTLDAYALTSQQLYQMMLRQFIHQNKQAKRMIKSHQGVITIRFDYPKAPINQLSFKCEQVSLDQSALLIEKVTIAVQQRLKSLQTLFQDIKQKLQNQYQQRLLILFKRLQKKSNDITIVFDEYISNKVNQFDKYVNTKEQQSECRFYKFMNDSIAKIISENSKLKKQIEMIPIRLDNKISILNHNIEVQQYRIDDLQKDIDHNQQKNEDEVMNLHAKIQHIAFELDEKINQLIKQFKQSDFKIDKDKPTNNQIQNQSSHIEAPLKLQQNIQEIIVKARKKQEYNQQQQYEQTLFKFQNSFSQYNSCFIDLFENDIPNNK